MKAYLVASTLIFLFASGKSQNIIYENGLIKHKENLIIEIDNQIKEDCDSEFLFTTDQIFPMGVASDGNNIWISGSETPVPDSTNSWTFIHDYDGNVVDTLIGNGSSLSISDLYIQEDTLWATVEQSAELYKLNKYSGEIYNLFQLPTINRDDPNNWGITFDGSFLWNSEYFQNSTSFLYKINPFDGSILDTLVINTPFMLSIEFINGKMYGIDFRNAELYMINLLNGELEYISDWCLFFPFGMSYEIETGSLYGISGSIESLGTQSVNKMSGFEFLTNSTSKSMNVDFTINPNPANDYIFVSSPLSFRGELQIFDFSGKILKTKRITEENIQIEIGDLPNGTYFVRINNGKSINVDQLIVIK